MVDRMREEFESWMSNRWPHTDFSRPGATTNSGQYWVTQVEIAWLAWQASREAVTIQLPDSEHGSAFALHQDDVIAAIEAAGLKVAP